MSKRVVTTKRRFIAVELEVTSRGILMPFELAIPENTTEIVGISAIGTCTGAVLTPIQTTNHYFGCAAVPGAYDDTFIQTLQKETLVNKNKVFSDTAAAGDFFYYARPKRLGPVYFNIDGVNGGMTLIPASIVSVTDSDNGYVEDYYLYESNYENLGTVTIAAR